MALDSKTSDLQFESMQVVEEEVFLHLSNFIFQCRLGYPQAVSTGSLQIFSIPQKCSGLFSSVYSEAFNRSAFVV